MNESKDQQLFPGTRVRVFNPRAYVNDVATPLSQTMQPATVLCWYGRRNWDGRWAYPNMVDVLFDSDPRVSHGHFTDSIEVLT